MTGYFARYEPVYDRAGDVVLYDVYFLHVDGSWQWWGSRRTLDQCQALRRFVQSQVTGRRPR